MIYEPDIYERTAQILQYAQMIRYKQSSDKDRFYDDPAEITISREIMAALAKSKTYHPNSNA